MDLLLRLQADALGVPVRRAAVRETTALGAAYLAGIAEGVWSMRDVASRWRSAADVEPGSESAEGYRMWRRAVERSLGWSGP
jgi:glycerol kinase